MLYHISRVHLPNFNSRDRKREGFLKNGKKKGEETYKPSNVTVEMTQENASVSSFLNASLFIQGIRLGFTNLTSAPTS